MSSKHLLLVALLGVVLLAASFASANPERPKRFYDDDILAKHKAHGPRPGSEQEKLYIHLIPHSHDDVGWLKTVDQYYYGANTTIQWAGVQYTIDTVLDELLKNSTRKYVQVETAFLYRWWIDSPVERQEQYRKLVESGQIEIINGGWCMSDEATPYYEDLVDQMTVGHQWLKEQFGEKGIPTIGWHIDPFGHQATNAALFSQMGFNAWWFSRIDYQDKDVRLSESTMEMIWSPTQASGEDNYIFTAVNYNHYNPPEHFNFDILSNDDPIMDNPRLEGYNIDWKSAEFVEYFRNMSAHFRSNHLLHTMGEDFNYANALMWYKNMDKLINYINARQDFFNVEILYSTPSIYLAEVNKQNITWPTKFDDFFPYADQIYGYWTGYFTSRVAIKGNVRDSGRYLQHLRNIFSVAKMTSSSKFLEDNYQLFLSNLDGFEQNMGILQHHDAVAGTEKQHVAYDYVYRLQNSTDRINEVLHPVLKEYASKEINEDVEYYQCRWNTTANNCTFTYEGLNSGRPILLNVYNPTVARSIVVKIKVPNVSFSIVDSDNKNIYGEVFCLNKYDRTDCDLYFEDEFDGYSYKYYKLVPGTGKNSVSNIIGRHVSFQRKSQKVKVSDEVSLTVNRFNTIFKLKTCSRRISENDEENQICTVNDFEVLYHYYPSYQGKGQKSGAYIFRPATEYIDTPIAYSETKNQFIFHGKLVTIVLIQGTHTDSQLRVYASDYYRHVVELETFIGSIPIKDKVGKEVVLLVNTPVINNQTFYTDSNGLELQKRILNYRPTWNLSVNEPSSGNYYPVNGMITIQDINSNKRISLVNDRSQGGTSLKEGQLELMIHRRLLCDDARGVGEPLNETEPYNNNTGLTQRVRHYIVFEEGNQTLSRRIQTHVDTYPIVFQSLSQTSNFNNVRLPNRFNPLKTNTDPFLKVYFRPFGDLYLLRLNNLNEVDASSYALPEGVEIIEEVTLTANQNKKEWEEKRYQWKTENSSGQNLKFSESSRLNRLLSQAEEQDNKLYVKPLELRAFIVSYNAGTSKQQQ
ncbi:hypothetical protein ABPG72_017560 [Tetrahymena utriculariae]